jgi:hypothetical protein
VELSLTFIRDHQLQYEKNVLEQTRNLDFEKLKTVKQLDLAQHEKHLMQKHNIAVRNTTSFPSRVRPSPHPPSMVCRTTTLRASAR